MSTSVNYPDVLGYITGGQRANMGVVQIAAALRPRIVRAGRPFEMLLLIQNAADIELDVVATLRLPDKDAKGQKGRFVTKAGRLIIRLEPAGVGVVTLPLSTLPDTAVSSDYKIGMEVKVTPTKKEKPNRVRTADGNNTFQLEKLPEERRQKITEFKSLNWTAETGLLRSAIIETELTIMSGTVGTFADLHPSWMSLWTLKDHEDKNYLLKRFAPVLKTQILPQFTIRQLLPVFREYTQKRFANSAYKLQAAEIDMIARLLTVLPLYAATDGKKASLMAVGKEYNVARYLEDGYIENPENAVLLPAWFEAFLGVLVKDDRLSAYPVKAIAHFMYDHIMRDAMHHAFTRIEELGGIEVGTLAERNAYLDNVFAGINNNVLDFDSLYMPLVLGGVTVCDMVLDKNEKPSEMVQELRQMIDARYREKNEKNAATFQLASQLIEQVANRYTMNQW